MNYDTFKFNMLQCFNRYISRMFTLPHLGDVTRYLKADFRNNVFLITDHQLIKCSGIMLAARSIVIEEIIQNGEKIPALQFSDNLPGLFLCLDLIYGGSVEINEENYRSIFMFGKIFQVEVMMDAVLVWVALEMPFYIFWKAYFYLTRLDPNNNNGTKDEFLIYAILYADDNCDYFLQTAFQACHNNSNENIREVMELVTSTTSITSDSKLAFFSDLVDIA